MNIHDELKQLRAWIEDGAKTSTVGYTKMDYYWNRYEFLCFRFGVGAGFIIGGGLGIIGLVFF